MVSDLHIARSAGQLGFNVPKAKKPSTVPMCVPCRQSKRKCSYTKNNTYPEEACLSCAEKGKGCSKPQLKSRAKRPDTSHNGRYSSANEASMLPNNTAPLPSAFEDTATVSCKQAIILLSLDEILSTCSEELVDLTTDMMRPSQRHSQRENGEDNVPELSAALNELNRMSQIVNYSMEKAACDAKGTTLFLAQNALRTHHFRRNLSWGVDPNAVVQCRRCIDQFADMGHTSLAYMLQVRLVKENVQLSETDLKTMAEWRNHFVADVDAFFDTISHKFSGLQMFTPKELVRIPIFGDAINADGRPDYLRRAVTQIRIDAGLPIQWPPDVITHEDVLGRTVVHQAAHRGYNPVISKLSKHGVDLERRCMNGLSLLHIAACQGHLDVVKSLMNLRPDLVNAPDSAGRTAFWYAARGSQFGIMGVMYLREDVNIDHKDKHGVSPASSAARDGRLDVLGYLINTESKKMKARISLNAERYIDHLPPLLFASEAGQYECVNLLLKRGVRTWKAGSPEYYRLLEMSKQRGDTKLEKKVRDQQNIDIDSQMYGSLADAGKFFYKSPEPEATKKPLVPIYPYALDPRARALSMNE